MACVERLCRSVPSELLVRALVLVVAAHEALEKCHGEERVEEHHKKDVEVSVVVRPPGGGERRVCVGDGPVCLALVDTRVLEKLTTTGEERKETTPVQVFRFKIGGHFSKMEKYSKQKSQGDKDESERPTSSMRGRHSPL